jgi:hypothetical protein
LAQAYEWLDSLASFAHAQRFVAAIFTDAQIFEYSARAHDRSVGSRAGDEDQRGAHSARRCRA